MTTHLEFRQTFALSERGQQRTELQDSVYNGHEVALVCDGMGGHPNGREAALEAKAAALAQLSCSRDASLKQRIDGAFDRAHRAVVSLSRPHHQGRTPGTTMVVALRDGSMFAVGHVGDSRAYWLSPHGNLARQLTVDHSVHGALTAYVGGPGGSTPRVYKSSVREPGHLLLTTDGVHNYCDLQAICRQVATQRLSANALWSALATAVRAEVERRSAPDNFSMVLASV